MKKIDNPKVFISYAWGSKEYQNKVLSFASSLSEDGIDVVIDKWSMVAGNDMGTFMEKSVKDPNITNVILLLDENYTKKADKRSGGVGTETQIISPKVYESVEQDRFVPVVFERNSKGEVCKPIYLQGRFHYDLSDDQNYDNEYMNLVRHLYGIETYRKPEIGRKPYWVEEQIEIKPLYTVRYDSLKHNKSEAEKKEQFEKFLHEIETKIIDYSKEISNSESDESYLDCYAATREIRTCFLEIIGKSAYIHDGVENVADFFENTFNELDEYSGIGNEICKILIHELFIYYVAWLLKKRMYKDLGYILGRTYFKNKPSYGGEYGNNYHLFYSGSLHERLDKAVCETDNKRYHSGTAKYWISNIDLSFCSKEDFIFADLMAYNYSLYGAEYRESLKWFPITYVYEEEYNSKMTHFARQLVSREKMHKALSLFGYASEDEFKKAFIEIENHFLNREHNDYRYSGCYASAPVLGYYIKSDQLGSVN
ncbi:MAG: TIR domain-containing protein [Butyrivibrio sp.]|nr:TIR domain-containing protein [Butyrivibrio sp.]